MSLSARHVAGLLLAALFCTLSTAACESGIAGNDQGTEPVNSDEEKEYKKAIVRCYKTGGTRVVKIMGELRCY